MAYFTFAVSDVFKMGISGTSNNSTKVVVVAFDGVRFDEETGIGGADGGVSGPDGGADGAGGSGGASGGSGGMGGGAGGSMDRDAAVAGGGAGSAGGAGGSGGASAVSSGTRGTSAPPSPASIGGERAPVKPRGNLRERQRLGRSNEWWPRWNQRQHDIQRWWECKQR